MAETLSGTNDSESETSDDSDVNDSPGDGGSEASATKHGKNSRTMLVCI